MDQITQELVNEIMATFVGDETRKNYAVTADEAGPHMMVYFRPKSASMVDVLKIIPLFSPLKLQVSAQPGDGDDEGPKVVFQGGYKGRLFQVVILLENTEVD